MIYEHIVALVTVEVRLPCILPCKSLCEYQELSHGQLAESSHGQLQIPVMVGAWTQFMNGMESIYTQSSVVVRVQT